MDFPTQPSPDRTPTNRATSANSGKKPWVKPVLIREPVKNTATTLGPSVFDSSLTS
ncbi:hypothetical protein APED_23005 [Acanthopleuribacter pedis]